MSHPNGVFSLMLDDLKSNLFEEHDLLGNGHDWERVVSRFVRDQASLSHLAVDYDSEADMFCMRSDTKSALLAVARALTPIYEDECRLEKLIEQYGAYED